MENLVPGGYSSYGQLAGILMSDSLIPRIPGDPGHAETLSFPVRYKVLKDFPFEDLVHGRRENLEIVIAAALELQHSGVRFIAADCGLFAPFQTEIIQRLMVPFIGSPLDMIPMLNRFLPAHKKIGVITGDTRLLKDHHLADYGMTCSDLIISGMDSCSEFESVVINHSPVLNVDNMRKGVCDAAAELIHHKEQLGAVVLECANLCTFRSDVQKLLKVPVFDLVSLLELFSGGYFLKQFKTDYL